LNPKAWTKMQRARFEALLAELSSRPDIAVQQASIGAPATEAQIATARRYASHSLPPALEALAREMNGFQLTWQSTQGDHGAVQLLPIERIFASWEGAVWFTDDEDMRFADDFPFDFFQPEVCAAFRMTPGTPPEALVRLHVLGEDSCSISLDFGQYVERLLAAKGYAHWQQALAPETRRNPEALKFHDRAPRLFPGLVLIDPPS
jgi:hypothetical protein